MSTTAPATADLPKQYDHAAAQDRWYAFWESRGYFNSDPPTAHKAGDGIAGAAASSPSPSTGEGRGEGAVKPNGKPFTIVIPPPNVTGALHLGHALNNTLQDIVIRTKRMQGYNTLWMPGTDHAGIATQAVVEKRLREEEGLDRHKLGREELVKRIWQWKTQYEARILGQLKQMGCSCDWRRTRFTLDEMCARAVRHTFFHMFKDRLIFRGKRLVNWDTFLQTAVADDEVYHDTVKGHFWHIRYPVIGADKSQGEPEFVTIATTRPETMLGDTAVAVHPDPAAALDKVERELREKLDAASAKEKATIQAEIDSLSHRRQAILPGLLKLRDMAQAGRKLMLPLANREIPLIVDQWAKPELGSGCVKITPAHDENDYQVWQRHKEIGAINIMTPEGTLNDAVPEKYRGLKMHTKGREAVIADLIAIGLHNPETDREDREIDLAHSDRSKTPIEPYLADQWFVRMGDNPDGTPGLAQKCMDAVSDYKTATVGRAAEPSPSGRGQGEGAAGKIKITPARYAKSYLDWLGEKRDWCIGRQLWWGHRVPVWIREMKVSELFDSEDPRTYCLFEQTFVESVVSVEELGGTRRWHDIEVNMPGSVEFRQLQETYDKEGDFDVRVYICPRPYLPLTIEQRREFADSANDARVRSHDDPLEQDRVQRFAEDAGFVQDPDVLDTWFSSALWPMSTLGWPGPALADQPQGPANPEWNDQKYYYPTSVLITSRDIITLWVARMVLTGLYNVGEIPFHDVYIHPKILDGYGETMSKSKGNGVDPIDIITKFGADALRFGLAYMATETQDVRMPVEFECPHCQKLVEQTQKNRTQPRIDCPHCKQPFSTQWAAKAEDAALPRAAVVSERFELGRNFCNKLWNAARFALLNLEGYAAGPVAIDKLTVEDQWILSRLPTVTSQVSEALDQYKFADAARLLYDFAWDEFCSFYLEMSKSRLQNESTRSTAQRILAHTLDVILRLLHPMTPFITEDVWQRLNAAAPMRGLTKPQAAAESVMIAPWPLADLSLVNEEIEARFARFQEVLGGLREMRARQGIAPKTTIHFAAKCDIATSKLLEPMRAYFETMAGAVLTEIGSSVAVPPLSANFTATGIEVFVDLAEHIDVAAEIARQQKEKAKQEQMIAAKERQLANEAFVSRAPPAVIAKERTALDELKATRVSTEATLAMLQAKKK
ncbi:MAG TPA: valine--tRNA ligase [Pirellulales bacterium]|jgi:valyl-tRNA synthetase|nr:valine--tRNA ligase [Pirellulales bacterium]